ncbi:MULTISPECIES: META domain-containing protein [Spirosoma]|uniref:META domain-containing protein n=1 Tax=Spirosoma TaxID=107 RepID=UPI001F0FB708|nr:MULTISPECIES: META domain-containing protein [Spirosoma]
MTLRLVLVLLLISAACRRPSTRLGATLTPTGQASRPVSTTPLPQLADYSSALKAGHELVATGTEPFWSLTINPSKNRLQFSTLTGDSLTTAVPPMTAGPDGSFRYETEAGADRITIQFRPDSCVNAMSGQRYDYRVAISYKRQNYAGCGASLRQVALLQDIWVLKTLNGKPVQAAGPRQEVPRLEIQLTEGRVMGTTGCNRLSGRVKADTRLIQFGPLAVTKMACLDESGRTEGDFLEALSQSLAYSVTNGTLTLLRDSKPIMTFRKVD